MTKHRSHSAAFKRQVAQEFLAGETLHGLSQRHDISRQLIRIWVGKLEAGALDEDVQAADLIQEYEARIAALERLVGRQALEIELLKGALKHAPRLKGATTSVVIGHPEAHHPAISRSPRSPTASLRETICERLTSLRSASFTCMCAVQSIPPAASARRRSWVRTRPQSPERVQR